MNSVKVMEVMEAVSLEEVATVEEDVMEIRIDPKTPGMVLISNRFISISAVPIGMLFRETVEIMLAANTAVQSLVAEAVTAVHAGNADVAEDDRSQKLMLICLTPAVENVATKNAVHIMAIALEEDRSEA